MTTIAVLPRATGGSGFNYDDVASSEPAMRTSLLAASSSEALSELSSGLSFYAYDGPSNLAPIVPSSWVGDPIDVVRMPDGGLTTLNNSRVLAAHEAGINAQARVHAFDSLIPEQFAGYYPTPKGAVPSTWGEAAMNRIGRQNVPYRTRWPFGSPFTGWDRS
ncbi:MAG TPA: hypothetical protein VGB64_03750 [Actinomycetota bacterium]